MKKIFLTLILGSFVISCAFADSTPYDKGYTPSICKRIFGNNDNTVSFMEVHKNKDPYFPGLNGDILTLTRTNNGKYKLTVKECASPIVGLASNPSICQTGSNQFLIFYKNTSSASSGELGYAVVDSNWNLIKENDQYLIPEPGWDFSPASVYCLAKDSNNCYCLDAYVNDNLDLPESSFLYANLLKIPKGWNGNTLPIISKAQVVGVNESIVAPDIYLEDDNPIGISVNASAQMNEYFFELDSSHSSIAYQKDMPPEATGNGYTSSEAPILNPFLNSGWYPRLKVYSKGLYEHGNPPALCAEAFLNGESVSLGAYDSGYSPCIAPISSLSTNTTDENSYLEVHERGGSLYADILDVCYNKDKQAYSLSVTKLTPSS